MLTASLKLRPSRYEDPTHSEVVTSVMENTTQPFCAVCIPILWKTVSRDAEVMDLLSRPATGHLTSGYNQPGLHPSDNTRLN